LPKSRSISNSAASVTYSECAFRYHAYFAEGVRMPGELQLALLGKPRLCLDGVSAGKFVFNKSMALLAYLATTGRPHTREALAGLLWGEMPNENARANLRKIVADLRQMVGEHVEITRHTVALNCDAPHWLDIDVFLAKLQGVRADVDTGTLNEYEVRLLNEAVALYIGDYLEGFYVRDAPDFEEWLIVQRERLRQLAVMALHTLARYHTARGSYAAGIDCTSRLLALEPWHEEFHQQMMLLLALSGQRSAALRQYEVCRQMLAKEMGAEPAAETVQLYQRLRSGKVAPRLPPTNPPNNLAAPVTPFVGREAEVAATTARLQDPECRLLTLVGIPGAGKSRLAMQIAGYLFNVFPDGVYAVALSPLVSGEGLSLAILQALGLPPEPPADFRSQLLDHLRSRRLLLVLDDLGNLPETVDFLLEVLQRAPKIKFLVTAGARLGLPGEWVQPVQGLATPVNAGPEDPDGYAAGRLFLASARRVHPDFAVEPADWPSVAHICRTLDGLPLALELAASWVRILPMAELVEEIGNDLDIVATTSTTLPERQRSLLAVFEYAWGQLERPEQELFLRLAVFQGGFSRRAAEEVAGADLRSLAALVDRCLLQVSAFGRWQMYEFLRQYGCAKLAQDPDQERTALDRHCAYFAADLQQRVALLDELRVEMRNIQAACLWANRRAQGHRRTAEDDAERLSRLCQTLDEGRQMVHNLIAPPPMAPDLPGPRQPLAVL
jgi:DNA-binding SARP family transcriptional activator/predicted ATPase